MSSMNDKDYYAILGVSKDASTEEIRKAFQKKAVKLHPDVNKEPGAEEAFKEVSEAYAVLSDPQKRSRYDAMRSGNPFASASTGAPSQGSPYSGGGYGGFGGYGWGFPFGGMGGMGSQRRRSRAYNPRVGDDVVMQVDIDPDLAKSGGRRGVTYQRYVPCEACDGHGSVHTEHSETCPTCKGTGHITVDVGMLGLGALVMDCPECEGTGRVVAEPCTVCGGSGRVLSASEIVVDIPAGAHDGDEIRIKGKGNAGTNGSSGGDFVFRVGVPSERLTASQSYGFQILGFLFPFFAYGALNGSIGVMVAVCAIPLVLGLFMVFRDGVGGHGGRWWRHAGSVFGNSAVQGAIIAFFIFAFFSCGSSLGRVGYGGYSY